MNNNQVNAVVDKIKELIAKGNVSRIVVCRQGKELVNIPVTAGVLGGVVMLAAAKWLLLTGVLATVGFGCTVTVVKDNGEEMNVLKEGDVQKVRDVAAGVVEDVKEAVIGKKEAVDFEDVVSQDEEQTSEEKPSEDSKIEWEYRE